MNQRRVAILAGVLILVVSGILLRGGSGGGGGGEDPGAGGAGRRAAAIRTDKAKARSAERRMAKLGVLGGVILDAKTREPLAGAQISLGRTSFDFGARLNPGQAKSHISAVSDADGRFRLVGLRPGEFSVTASMRGYLPVTLDRIGLRSGEQHLELELLAFRGGHELTGEVTDVGGGPVAGAFVHLRRISEATVTAVFRAPVTAFSDDDGRYSVWLQDGSYLAEAGHADYVTVRRDTAMQGADRSEDFVLVPGGTIEGRVLVSGTEQPVADAVVTLSPAGARITGIVFGPAAKTGPKGRFVLTGLKSGEVSLLATARGHASKAPKTVVVGIAETRSEVIVYVDKAFRISGFVVEQSDEERGVGRALVAAYNLGRRTGAVTSEPSAADGFFEIVGVMPGSYALGVASEGYEPQIAGAQVEVVDSDVEGVVLRLDRGLTIRGRVDPPVPAFVRLEVDRDSVSLLAIPRIMASQLSRTRADENGRFELTGLAEGKVIVVAEHLDHGFGRESVDISRPGVTGVVVKLEGAASIAGRVSDVAGNPVVRARVSAGRPKAIGFGSSFGDWNSALTDHSGRFSVRGLSGGEHKLSVRLEGRELAWAGTTLSDASAPRTPLDIVLHDGEERKNVNLVVESVNETISGRVVDGAGDPVADAWVRVGQLDGVNQFRDRRREANDDNDVSIETDDTLRTRISPRLTDAEGEFKFRNLTAGEYWASATGPGEGTTGTVKPVTTGSTIVIALAPMGSARGAVTAGGQPVAQFTLKIDGPRRVRQPVSNASGTYAVDRLPAGRYEFQIQSEIGFGRQAVTIAGEPVVVNFEIESYSEVTGRVVGVKSQKPMSGVPVLAFSEGGDTDAIGAQVMTGDVPTTDGDGRFSISRQGVGNVTIMVIGVVGGAEPIGMGTVTLVTGKNVDAGTIYAVDDPVVAEAARGTFGLGLTGATFANRPNSDDGAVPPAGASDSEKFLWPYEVIDGGAADKAGVVMGDRIVTIDGIEVALIGTATARYMLGASHNAIGTVRTLGISRSGEELVAGIVAAAPAP